MSATTAFDQSKGLASSRDEAIEIACSCCFHRTLWLSETVDHPRLRVTYSTTTNFDKTSLPVILFIGPMFGSRWNALDFDKLARDCGVRLVCVDRPATGGSTPVSIDIRMKVWLETVPVLLRELDIKHVSLMTHSAGTLYTLNTLLHHRSLLDPKAPIVAFLAPFVTATASGAALPTFLSKLPLGMMDSWAHLNKVVNETALASASWSGTLRSAAISLFASPSEKSPSAMEVSSVDRSSSGTREQDIVKAAEQLSIKYRFAEDTNGANEEAKLCLRKCKAADWGEAQDYMSCITKIAQQEQILQLQDPNSVKLKINACFSGSDVMIGKRGQKYFEQCWLRDGVHEHVNFTTRTYPDANHDTLITSFAKGALQDAMKMIAKSLTLPNGM